MAWKVAWSVLIDGQDVTANMRPFLTDISVSDKDGTASDSCSLSFDDSGGQALLPQDGARVIIALEGAQIFEGTVDSVRSAGSRGGGRMLSVTAKGFDAKGKVKDGQRWHMDDATLQEALGKAAEMGGLAGVVLDPAFAAIRRPYWSPDGETFLGWGQKLARELGATFKIRGDRAVLAKRGQGLSAAGGAMPTVLARIPGNVISWEISPVANRGRYKRATVRFFDRENATFRTEEVTVEGVEGVEASDAVQTDAADADQAKGIAEARGRESEREGGGGTIEMDLAVEAQAEGTVILAGARPGIDGTYRIVGVTHKATRSGGATTSLEIKQPTGEAGKDGRAASGAPPASVPVPTPAPR
ncbi:late control D family protein [Aurantimonas aggregata]|uniref:Late control D family protein n=1 Tax=Aurantimonas aggregata TaxID=2047720 RepID=A0A6L9MM70_9HYPH|nr:late control D family protein [Aurantimonas aggregata]NDV88815.1 late control D family protein [Aurantimonas aggregata]